MAYSIVEKAGKRILLITVSDPFDFRTELAQFLEQLQTTLGEISNTVYIVYDVRELSLNFADIIKAVTGFGRPQSEFDKRLQLHSRMMLVGSSTLINIAAKTAAKMMPDKPTLVFDTPEKALEYARAELEKQH